MAQTRREFWLTIGGAASAPLLWQAAESEAQGGGEISLDTVLMLLDLQGSRGIYENPEHLEELRAAVGRIIGSHKALREFEVPDDVQPALVFRRD